ncbi:MAG: calcium-translocating P-type ATPase, PMCA-type [Muribaculaceae bacterium]|nr:calcium-translocating P-type ATPase, PMCA-type [Muribaculaceae bacterium]
MSEEHSYNGLTSAEVDASRAAHGMNILTPAERPSMWCLFLDKFKDPLIAILLVAGVLSVGISCYEYWCLNDGAAVFFEPVGIFAAIFLATGLAFLFEQKAEKEFAVLNQVNDDEPVTVIRNGNVTSVPKRDVVVGDIAILSTGEEIPADGILLESTSLSVDESTLTGEPMCEKNADKSKADAEATFPSWRVLRGTKVMDGHGVMQVEAVGDATENGKVFEASQINDNVVTPLDEQLGRLGKAITIGSYIVAGLIVAGRISMYFIHDHSFDWMEFISYLLRTLMVAVTLIVVSVPEGLPMAVTLSLAYSMRRMLRTNNLVRKLHACETMGATTVICTDKTGTLTRNQMQVFQMQFYGNPSEDIVNEGIALNATAQLDLSHDKPAVLGNPTEGALLLWLRDKGVNYAELKESARIVAEVPFNTERKYMATEVQGASGNIIYVKGAPEIVYDMCGDKSGVTKAELDAQLLEYQQMAMRTLAFAYQQLEPGQNGIADGKIVADKLHFLGIAAISDPVRDDVPDAVKEVLDAGIQVKIVTGDTPGTAKEIGRQIGLWHDGEDTDANIVSGSDIAAMSDEELRRRVEDFKIIARARPMDKRRLVDALQSHDEVVAVTGDGTNDAPALKAAQVGLSMGDGTSVAKEASDITIIDNSFASIGRAVMWGRSLYRNIQRFILFQMTVNVVACLIVLAGAFLGMDSPLTVTQMLWVNLIMDTFAAMALASLPPTESVMKEKPRRRSDFIINRSMGELILGAGLIFTAVLFTLLYYFEHTPINSFADLGMPMVNSEASNLTTYEMSFFFTTFVFLQFWNMFNARAFATGRSAFHFRDCGGFLLTAAMIVVGQVLIVNVGGNFFSVAPMDLKSWILIVGSTSVVLFIGELWRLIANHRPSAKH